MRKQNIILFLLTTSFVNIFAQQKHLIGVSRISGRNVIDITDNGKPFTQFIFPDSQEKPVLYPIYAPDQNLVTRGYPVAPRPGEPTDHPHHLGLWMNYENVNGLDFWNNSFAIPASKKNLYGWIKVNAITQTKSGNRGILSYTANWENQQEEILLQETTTYIFSANDGQRIVDRITTLRAEQDVLFKDAKDGFLGLRVAHELELPSKDERQFVDDKGNVTKVAANNNSGVTGDYLTSEGKHGDGAWGTRGAWCMLFGKIKNDSISIAIIDHPKNLGYPTYWHARGYGLFAANPLGQKIFSNGKEELNFKLLKGKSVTFRYRIIIASGQTRLPVSELEKLSRDFAK
ncbi:MAG: PmoA family protein [Bacteroidetes bacterium]|nr:PmoA family protein [Bacteroidota bacterium]MBS1975343.1 PmoA family protein [Bacteroidota bacterium]